MLRDRIIAFAARKILLFSAIITLMLGLATVYIINSSILELIIAHDKYGAISLAKHLLDNLPNFDITSNEPIENDALAAKLEHHIEDFGLFKLKIFSKDGIAIYSTEKTEIGKRNSHDYFVKKVRNGEIFQKIVHKERRTEDGTAEPLEVIETYVPIMDNGVFKGAFEIYSNLTDSMGRLRSILYKVSGHAALLGAILLSVIVYINRKTAQLESMVAVKELLLERQHAEKGWRESEERYRILFENSSDGILLLDAERIVECNQAAISMFGHGDKSSLLTSDPSALFPSYPNDHADTASLRESIERALRDGSTNCERLARRRSGQAFVAELTLSAVTIGDDRLAHCIVRDITDRKRHEETIHRLAYSDPLTGLPNRTAFLLRLTKAIERSKEDNDHQFAVLFLDLDRFKVVNDSLGHATGDAMLRQVGESLKRCVRGNDLIARFGGDEFVLLLDDLTSMGQALHVIQRIQTSLSQPFLVSGHEIYTSASIGLVLSDPATDNCDHILRDADTAMYKAKQRGKGLFQIFRSDMHLQALQIMNMETDLRKALERDELILHYQPIMDLASGSIVGLEALVRWRSPERGLIGPRDFIPLAEETGLIVPIGNRVLREACLRLREINARLERPIQMNVNVSVKQLLHGDLRGEVEAVLLDTGIRPEWLQLELTESGLMDVSPSASSTLASLRIMGVSIAIDDFGTGYSSLGYLHTLPVNTLKVDRSFTSAIASDQDSRPKILKTIMSLADSLSLDVVAEGIETRQQLTHLQSLGCRYGQGYYFFKPLPFEQATALIIPGAAGLPSLGPAPSPDRTIRIDSDPEFMDPVTVVRGSGNRRH